MAKKIKIAFDLDGVIARHSLGGFWVKLRLLKEKFLKRVHSSSYYYPQTFLEKEAWKIINWLRTPDEEGIATLKKMKNKKFNFFLITGRFKFNYPLTINWLKKHAIFNLFDKVLVNTQDINPTEFKKQKIREFKIEYFVDDDLQVFSALSLMRMKSYWIACSGQRAENPPSDIIVCKDLKDALGRIEKELSITGK